MLAEWRSPGHCELLWGEQKLATYKTIAYDRLPPLAARDDVDWLPPCPPDVEGLPLVVEGNQSAPRVRERARSVARAVRRHGLALPASFVRFVSEPALCARVPKITGCYVEIPPDVTQVAGEWILPFMHDLLLRWSLWLTPGEPARVVIGIDELRLCASSFEEFLERFWIESTVWLVSQGRAQLDDRLRAYLAAANPS